MFKLINIGIAAIVAIGHVTVMSLSQADAQISTALFEVQLTKPLGFYQQPDSDGPNVFSNFDSLQPPMRVRIAGMTGPLWTVGTFCNAEHGGKLGFIRCDDPTAVTILTATSNAPLIVPVSQCNVSMTDGPYYTPDTSYVIKPRENYFGTVFCGTVPDCMAFCTRHCTLCLNEWKETESGNDGATTCPGAPQTGAGMVPENSTYMYEGPIPSMDFVQASSDVRATKETVEHLKQLNDYMATSQEWADKKYIVRVKNCYRPALIDIEKECNFVMKSLHQLNKFPGDARSEVWKRKLNPQNVGLAWPGANAHSAGNSCDMVVVDSKRKVLFDSKVDPESPTSRATLRMLDEAVTIVGGKRLTYEAWHYEWSNLTESESRCQHPRCDNAYWPPCGRPNC